MRRTSLREKGITLIALVVTIIVLLILAGITINMAIDNNGLIQRAKDASEVYAQAENNETKQLSEFADSIDELTGKTGLSQDKITAVNSRIYNLEEELQEVSYEAKEVTDDETSVAGNGRKVIVEGAYSGTGTDQTFYQSDIGAIGSSKLKWYVLSADENGVNLVSESTRKPVQFKDSPGYDNCLYYLNELSTKLFANEDYGVTENRIHAFRLTDIKDAAEQANKEHKVTDSTTGEERDWNWDLDVIKASNRFAYNNGNVGQKTYTPRNKYYPGIYTADTNKEVVANNPMYDEKPGSKITTDSGIQRELDDGSNPASKLTVKHTFFGTDYNATTLTRLGKFGESNIGKNLFNASGTNYWLASRCVAAGSSFASFSLRYVESGYLNGGSLCDSRGNVSNASYAFRVVVSVPGNRVNIEENGTVTLKQANS